MPSPIQPALVPEAMPIEVLVAIVAPGLALHIDPIPARLSPHIRVVGAVRQTRSDLSPSGLFHER